jgi:hypothetical protein
MNADDTSGVRIKASPVRSQPSTSGAGTSSPLVTTTHARLDSNTFFSTATCCSRVSVFRYATSVLPKTCRRSG